MNDNDESSSSGNSNGNGDGDADGDVAFIVDAGTQIIPCVIADWNVHKSISDTRSNLAASAVLLGASLPRSYVRPTPVPTIDPTHGTTCGPTPGPTISLPVRHPVQQQLYKTDFNQPRMQLGLLWYHTTLRQSLVSLDKSG